MSVEERRDRHETERRYERGVVDLTDGGGATVSGTMQDRLESDQVLRRVKGVLDIRVHRRWNRRPERLPGRLAYSLPSIAGSTAYWQRTRRDTRCRRIAER